MLPRAESEPDARENDAATTIESQQLRASDDGVGAAATAVERQ